jgi:hypothetical protein
MGHVVDNAYNSFHVTSIFPEDKRKLGIHASVKVKGL